MFTRTELIAALLANGYAVDSHIEGGRFTVYKSTKLDQSVLVGRRTNHFIEDGEDRTEIDSLDQIGSVKAAPAKKANIAARVGSSNTAVKKSKKTGDEPAVDEGELRKKYAQVVPGTLRKETAGKWAQKYTVEIKTLGVDMKPDGNTRRVATSDLFQVRHTEETYAILRNLRRREKYSDNKGTRPAPARKAAAAK